MCSRVTSSESYCEALNIIGEYVNITDGSEQSDDIEEVVRVYWMQGRRTCMK